MKKDIFVAAFILMSVVSCSSRRTYTDSRRYDKRETSHNQQIEQQKRDKLSKMYGFRITPDDNLRLYEACSQWFGVKHKWGGNTKAGVDCSGLVKIIFKQVYNIDTERNSALILRRNCVRIKRGDLHEGDLVFFHTFGNDAPDVPTHVGIYLKNRRFVHVSATRGVTVSNLTSPYYKRTWITGGRIK